MKQPNKSCVCVDYGCSQTEWISQHWGFFTDHSCASLERENLEQANESEGAHNFNPHTTTTGLFKSSQQKWTYGKLRLPPSSSSVLMQRTDRIDSLMLQSKPKYPVHRPFHLGVLHRLDSLMLQSNPKNPRIVHRPFHLGVLPISRLAVPANPRLIILHRLNRHRTQVNRHPSTL